MKKNNSVVLIFVMFFGYSCQSQRNAQVKLIELSKRIYLNDFEFSKHVEFDSIYQHTISSERIMLYFYKDKEKIKTELHDMDSNLFMLSYNINDSIVLIFEGVKLTKENIFDNAIQLRINNKINGMFWNHSKINFYFNGINNSEFYNDKFQYYSDSIEYKAIIIRDLLLTLNH